MIGRVFEYTSVIFSVVGSAILVTRGRKGFLIFIVGFIPAALFACYYKHYGLLFLCVYFLVANIYGYLNWKKRGY